MKPCKICNVKPGTQRHHCFPNTKPNRKIYGKFLDMDFNIIMVCPDCHVSHAHVPAELIWDEYTFRFNAFLADVKLPDGSKVYQGKLLRGAFKDINKKEC